MLNNVETNKLKSLTKLIDMENLIRHQILSLQISNIRRKYEIALFNILTNHGLEKFDPQIKEIISGLRGCEHFLLRESEAAWEFGTLSPEGDYKTFYSLLNKRRTQIILTKSYEENNDRFQGNEGRITLDIQQAQALKRANQRQNNRRKPNFNTFNNFRRYTPYNNRPYQHRGRGRYFTNNNTGRGIRGSFRGRGRGRGPSFRGRGYYRGRGRGYYQNQRNTQNHQYNKQPQDNTQKSF